MAEPRRASPWPVFAVVAVGVLMATIDSSIVNVSLPTIAEYFDLRVGGSVEWVVIGYLVVVAALLLTAGRLSDLFGRRRAWGGGLAVFTIASALCGLAPSIGWLVGFRVMQGLGAAFVMAVSPAMIVGAFPPDQRGRALGLNALIVGLGISVGPTLGGLITQHLGWRWIFYVNVPLGVAGVAGSVKVLRPEGRLGRSRVDWTGAVLLAVGLGGLTATLCFGPEVGWRFPPLLGGGAIALLALWALWRHLRSTVDPLLDPRLFGNRRFALASASLLLSFVATAAVPFLMPFYLEHLRGWPPARTGLLLTPLPATAAVLSPVSGAVADRIGTPFLSALGMLIAATGLALLALIDETASIPYIVLLLALIGAGQAIFRPPNNSALMGAVSRDKQGAAAGVLATARVIGQSFGVAGAGALFAGFGGMAAVHGAPGRGHIDMANAAVEPFLRGLRGALWGCTLVALASAGAALVRERERG